MSQLSRAFLTLKFPHTVSVLILSFIKSVSYLLGKCHQLASTHDGPRLEHLNDYYLHLVIN